MKHRHALAFYLLVILSLLWPAGPTFATLPPPPSPTALPPVGGEADVPRDELSPAQESAMWEAIHRNVLMLRRTGQLAEADTTLTVTFNWPLRMAPGLPDNAGFTVSAFSDHNPAAGQVLDYNGGARTYDGHRGTDIALYPFKWNKVDAGAVQVLAAAAGTIVYKGNTDPTDHNPCDGGSSGDQWNYIALAHADGRMTIYGHMRYNSLTSKGIGATVAQGEYLGQVASSGNSSGPHLHFEARVDSTPNGAWIDPYAGPNSQPESLWASQRPYYDSAINLIATHSGPPSTPDPCQPSLTKFQDSFTTPVTIYFYSYYRDFQGALPTQFTIYRPDNTVYQAWSYTTATTFSSGWSYARAFAFSSSDPSGTWRFEAIYNGQTTQSYFNLNAPTAITVISPNGGEQWSRPVTHTLTWADNLGGLVNIALYHNGVYSAAIVYNTPSVGQFVWTPSPTQPATSGYRIRVTSVISPLVYDESNAPFTLLASYPAPRFTLTKTASVLTPIPGQSMNYTIRVTNTGSGAATGARIADVLSAGVTQAGPLSVSPAGLGTVGTLPEAVTNLTLAAGQALTVTIPVLVTSGQAAGTRITNTATITSAQFLTPTLAAVAITIADAPLVAHDDYALTPLNTPITIYPLGNDGDPNGDALSITAVGTPLTGTVSLLGTYVVYTPTLDVFGAAVFTYTVSTASASAEAQVMVLVVTEVKRVYLPLLGR